MRPSKEENCPWTLSVGFLHLIKLYVIFWTVIFWNQSLTKGMKILLCQSSLPLELRTILQISLARGRNAIRASTTMATTSAKLPSHTLNHSAWSWPLVAWQTRFLPISLGFCPSPLKLTAHKLVRYNIAPMWQHPPEEWYSVQVGIKPVFSFHLHFSVLHI